MWSRSIELSAVAAVAEQLREVAPIGVRVNPNINAVTHPYISTGLHGHKFGVPRDRAWPFSRRPTAHPWLRPVGLAAHIGSQITDLEPYAQSVDFLVKLADELAGHAALSWTTSTSAVDWVSAMRSMRRLLTSGRLLSRPQSGRRATHWSWSRDARLWARRGCLLTRVVYTKAQGDKRFVIVDAGMTDLLRPTLYQAYHPMVPVLDPQTSTLERVDVVGPICETGDWLARDRDLPPLAPGDLVAVLYAGAYGYAMSSNYNGHLRPAEVMVSGSEFEVIRRRQTYADLVAGTDPVVLF